LQIEREIPCNIIHRALSRTPWGAAFVRFQRMSRGILKIPVLNVVWRSTAMSALVRFPGPYWAPVIRYRNHKWTTR